MGWTFLFLKKHVLLGHPTAQLQSQLKEKLKLNTAELKKEIVVKQEKINDVLELEDLLSNLSE